MSMLVLQTYCRCILKIIMIIKIYMDLKTILLVFCFSVCMKGKNPQASMINEQLSQVSHVHVEQRVLLRHAAILVVPSFVAG